MKDGALDVGAAHALFGPLAVSYAVAPDGQRFIAPATPRESGRAPLMLLLNWMAALRK